MGRKKGFSHSEQTKIKIGKGVESGRERIPWNFLSLEEALKLSLEEEAVYCCQRYHINPGTKFEIFSIDWDGEWVMNYLERGLKEAFVRVEQTLGWKQTQYVSIRTGEGEVEDRNDITAIGKIVWKGKEKYVVGLYTDYTGGLVEEEDSSREIK